MAAMDSTRRFGHRRHAKSPNLIGLKESSSGRVFKNGKVASTANPSAVILHRESDGGCRSRDGRSPTPALCLWRGPPQPLYDRYTVTKRVNIGPNSLSRALHVTPCTITLTLIVQVERAAFKVWTQPHHLRQLRRRTLKQQYLLKCSILTAREELTFVAIITEYLLKMLFLTE